MSDGYQQSSWDLFVDWSQNHSAVMGIGGTIASGILNAYLAQAEAERQRELAKEVIRTIVQRINEAESKIIYTIEKLNLDRLQGHLRGLALIWDEYDDIPDDRAMLEDIIFNSAMVQGELEVLVDAVQHNRNSAIKAYSLYAAVVPLRLAAMAERKRAFGVNDDADILRRLLETERRVALMSPPLLSMGEDQVRIISMDLVNCDGSPRPAPNPNSLGWRVTCCCQGKEIASGNIPFGDGSEVEESCKRLQKEKVALAEAGHVTFRNSISALRSGYERGTA